MPAEDGLFGLYSRLYENQREVEMPLEEYLRGCRNDNIRNVSNLLLREIVRDHLEVDKSDYAALLFSNEKSLSRSG